MFLLCCLYNICVAENCRIDFFLRTISHLPRQCHDFHYFGFVKCWCHQWVFCGTIMEAFRRQRRFWDANLALPLQCEQGLNKSSKRVYGSCTRADGDNYAIFCRCRCHHHCSIWAQSLQYHPFLKAKKMSISSHVNLSLSKLLICFTS